MPSVFFSSRTTVLDCGASRTALGVFSRQGSDLRLDDCAVEALPMTTGGDGNWLEHTRTALQGLRPKVKTAGPVVLVLPAHLVLTKLIKTPRVEAAKRAMIIRFEAEQSIPFALTDVVWDSVVAGEHDRDLDVLLAAAKLDAIQPLCAAVQAAGFEPRLILPAPLATLAAFRLSHPAQTGSSLVINLGARSTILLLVEPKRFAGRTLALGSRLDLPITGSQHGVTEDAGTIKQSEHSVSLTTDAMETLVTRLAQEIARSVLYYRRQCDLTQPARVHLTGGGARLVGLGEALAKKLKIPVDRLDALGVIAISSGAAKSVAVGQALSLTDLIGAAATQLRPGQPVLNLLPQNLRRHGNLRRRQPWLLFAAVLAVAAMLPPVLHYRNVTGEAQRKTAAIERELSPLRERDGRNRTNLRRLEEFKQQVAQLQSVYDRRTSWLNLLADLQDRLARAEDVWLEKLQVTPANASGPVKLLLSGRMLDKANPLAKVSVETSNRVKALLRDIDRSPYVNVAEEGQRFDTTQPGILKFDFVLVANPQRPL